MKKVLALCGLSFMLLTEFALATTLTVQVKQAELRSEPSFFGKITTRVKYRSAVNVLEERGAWRLVTFNGKQGWMHSSNLFANSSTLIAGKGLSSSVSSREVSLAGKGFNKETEYAFKQQHRNLNFDWVDKMERVKTSSAELENFALQSDFPRISR